MNRRPPITKNTMKIFLLFTLVTTKLAKSSPQVSTIPVPSAHFSTKTLHFTSSANLLTLTSYSSSGSCILTHFFSLSSFQTYTFTLGLAACKRLKVTRMRLTASVFVSYISDNGFLNWFVLEPGKDFPGWKTVEFDVFGGNALEKGVEYEIIKLVQHIGEYEFFVLYQKTTGPSGKYPDKNFMFFSRTSKGNEFDNSCTLEQREFFYGIKDVLVKRDLGPLNDIWSVNWCDNMDNFVMSGLFVGYRGDPPKLEQESSSPANKERINAYLGINSKWVFFRASDYTERGRFQVSSSNKAYLGGWTYGTPTQSALDVTYNLDFTQTKATFCTPLYSNYENIRFESDLFDKCKDTPLSKLGKNEYVFDVNISEKWVGVVKVADKVNGDYRDLIVNVGGAALPEIDLSKQRAASGFYGVFWVDQQIGESAAINYVTEREFIEV